jgi:transcriptional regulator with XRE-family HTH domain
MEIIFKEEKNNLFGSTKMLGIGKRQPELIYGKKAKELREKANLTIEELASEFKMKPFDLERLEDQKQALTDKIYEKYKKKFDVEKEYFFDLDVERLIISAEGHILKTFETSEECQKTFKYLLDEYFKVIEKGYDKLIIDFDNIDIKRGDK